MKRGNRFQFEMSQSAKTKKKLAIVFSDGIARCIVEACLNGIVGDRCAINPFRLRTISPNNEAEKETIYSKRE